MALHAALLRGINLGNRRLEMDELRGHFEDLGLTDAETYLASGNVVFGHAGSDLPDLEREIEAHLEGALGYDVPTFVRPLSRLQELRDLDLVSPAREDGFTPYVIFCRDEPDAAAADGLGALETADDRFVVRGREVVYLRRGRLTDSSIETRDLERVLGSGYTRRKLTTVERLVARFGEA